MPPPSTPSTSTSRGAVVLDDGTFHVELNATSPAARAFGFLERRVPVSARHPGGFYCLGSFHMHADGTWRASINVPYDESTGSDSMRVLEGASRIEAIVALWRARHLAHKAV